MLDESEFHDLGHLSTQSLIKNLQPLKCIYLLIQHQNRRESYIVKTYDTDPTVELADKRSRDLILLSNGIVCEGNFFGEVRWSLDDLDREKSDENDQCLRVIVPNHHNESLPSYFFSMFTWEIQSKVEGDSPYTVYKLMSASSNIFLIQRCPLRLLNIEKNNIY